MSAVDTVFLDSNVLVYAHDRGEPTKGALAKTLLTELVKGGRPVISVQVLSEFYWVATRKISIPLTHDEATAEIVRLEALLNVVPVTEKILEKALELIAAHKLPLWDAQIVAASKLHGGKTVLSEDFSTGIHWTASCC